MCVSKDSWGNNTRNYKHTEKTYCQILSSNCEWNGQTTYTKHTDFSNRCMQYDFKIKLF